MGKQKIQNYLHELITNLSQTEKRYFKIIAKQQTPGKKNDYIKLFEAIDKQKEFDEAAIKKQFKGTSIEKRYASLKKYLYELIIKSLTIYHADNVSLIRVRRLMDSAEILVRKGLYHQALRRLEKAEKLAEEVGSIFIIHDIRRLYISCQSMIDEYPDKQGVEIFKARQNYITDRIYQCNTIFNKGQDVIYNAMFAQDEKSKYNPEGFKTVLDEAFFEMEDELMGGYNKHLYYRTLKQYYGSLNDTEKLREVTIKHTEVFEQGDMHKRHFPSNYIQAIMDVVEFLRSSGQFSEIEYWIAKAKDFFDEDHVSNYNKDNSMGHMFCLELTNLLQNNKPQEALNKTPELLDFLDQRKHRINHYALRWNYYNLSWIYLFNGELKTALKWSNELLNDHNLPASNFLYTGAVLQNILIHLELKNLNFLEYTIPNLRKELNKKCVLSALEKTTLEQLEQLSGKITSSNLSNQQLFEEVFKRFNQHQLSTNDFTNHLVKLWLQAKTGDKSQQPVSSKLNPR